MEAGISLQVIGLFDSQQKKLVCKVAQVSVRRSVFPTHLTITSPAPLGRGVFKSVADLGQFWDHSLSYRDPSDVC